MAGIKIASICGDGASENVKYFKKQCTDTLDDWLSEPAKDLFKKAGLEVYMKFKCITIDKVTGKPIWLLEDMPHLIKRIVNSMDRSSNDNESRNLQYGSLKLVFDLWELAKVWYAMGGSTNQLSETKLTEGHFKRDSWAKMRCGPAMQIVSDSVFNMLQIACSDPEILNELGREAEFYEPMKKLVSHVNKLVDIVNGRNPLENKRADFTPETGCKIQEDLIDILKWFDGWKTLNDSLNQPKEAFLADETWNGLRRMILGYIGIIDYYVIGKGVAFDPRRTLSDPCEHLFSRLRNVSGATNCFNAKDAISYVTNEDVLNQCRGENVCYGGINAEAAVGRETKSKTKDKRKVVVGNQFVGREGRSKKPKIETHK